jgi:hypothetical protein
MHRSKENTLPPNKSPKEQANSFNDYFKCKIENIRSTFDNDIESAMNYDSKPEGVTPLVAFTPISEEAIRKIILSQANKSCESDPIPTSLLKSCLDDLLPIVTRIVNLSITSGQFPEIYKTAIVKPLLKKDNLDKIPKNYRPVSNLTFVSKVIEEAVC